MNVRRQLMPICRVASAVVVTGIFCGSASAQQPMPARATTNAPLVLRGVTVVDVEEGKLLPDRQVVIAGNRIQAVDDGRTTPAGARVVDARGKYLIPGLWDMHVHAYHHTDLFYPLFVASGVTGFRDAWTDVPLDTMRLWRQEILAGTRIGPPRQILSGAKIDEDVGCTRTGIVGQICMRPGDTADARALVAELKAAGADMVKTYTLGYPSYFALAAAARRVGMRFGGHVATTNERDSATFAALQQQFITGFSTTARGATAAEASDSGASIIDHLNSSGGLDTLCAGVQGSVDRCQPMAERFRQHGTWWVPTLAVGSRALDRFDSLFWIGLARRDDWRAALNRLAQTANAALAVPSSPSQDSVVSVFEDLRVAARVGMPILAGTDASFFDGAMTHPQRAGFGMHVELALLVAAGLTPLEALRSATIGPARMLHGTDSLGTVSPGRLADLVLLDADPLADITNVAAIQAVIADGRYFDRAALDQLASEVQRLHKTQHP